MQYMHDIRFLYSIDFPKMVKRIAWKKGLGSQAFSCLHVPQTLHCHYTAPNYQKFRGNGGQHYIELAVDASVLGSEAFLGDT